MPEFTALADFLAQRAAPVVECVPEPVAERERVDDAGDVAEPSAHDANAIADAVADARLFRARLQDALRDAFGALLERLAADVLARELCVAPCDLQALLARTLARVPAVRVHVAPGDACALAGVDVVVDATLQHGDVVLVLDEGEIDARFGVRLATALEHFA